MKSRVPHSLGYSDIDCSANKFRAEVLWQLSVAFVECSLVQTVTGLQQSKYPLSGSSCQQVFLVRHWAKTSRSSLLNGRHQIIEFFDSKHPNVPN